MIGSTGDMYRNYDKSDAKTLCTNFTNFDHNQSKEKRWNEPLSCTNMIWVWDTHTTYL
mgnify:CR=1 FL=1